MKNKQMRLLVFSIVCIGLVSAFFYFDVMKYIGQGEYAQFVVEGKPTVYVFYDEKDMQGNAYKIATETVTTVGTKYGESISMFPVSKEFSESDFYKDTFRISKYPTLVIVNDRGYIVGHYEGILDLDRIDYDLSVLAKKGDE